MLQNYQDLGGYHRNILRVSIALARQDESLSCVWRSLEQTRRDQHSYPYLLCSAPVMAGKFLTYEEPSSES
jgi:hypothetical protein